MGVTSKRTRRMFFDKFPFFVHYFPIICLTSLCRICYRTHTEYSMGFFYHNGKKHIEFYSKFFYSKTKPTLLRFE